jgi:hypothetical protein
MSTTIIDPVAQTFIIDGQNYPQGAFLSSICLFFRTKPTTNIPVQLSILPTLNGYPTGSSLDYSVVSLNATDVVAGTTATENPHYKNPSSWTKFTFPVPVYISPDTLYAFTVQSASGDYTLWTAAQNDTALLSTSVANYTDKPATTATKISTSPYVGTLFESQNGQTWSADLSKDLMFVINRCKFDTSYSPVVPFVVPAGLPQRKKIEINTATATSNAIYDTLNLSTTDLTPPGTTINYQYTATLNRNGTSDGPHSVIPGKLGTPKSQDIYLNDNKGPRVLNYAANDSFKLQATLSTNNDQVSPVLSDDGLNLYTVRYRINDMGLSNDNIILVSGGAGYLPEIEGANGKIYYPQIRVSDPDEVNGSLAEVEANVYMGIIDSVYVVNPGSGYTQTPTITISATSNTAAVVQVNGETSVSGGNGLARYITMPITLSEGSDSADLRVFFSAYRPPNTGIHVYYKVVARDDTQKIDDGDWTLMTLVSGQNKYSTSMNDIIEFEAAPGTGNNPDNQITYTSKDTGYSYTSFYRYMIKIVLSANDSTFSPFLKDMRTIALPSGTGL